MNRPIPNGGSWITQAYSSYQNQQQMLERIHRLEEMLVLLIQNTQGPVVSIINRDQLFDFAATLQSEKDQT